jgi:hypothetical protein
MAGFLAALSCAASVKADCIAQVFPKGQNPRNPSYEVVACGPAEPIVERLRKSRPDWYGVFSYAAGDVVITVRAANEDARKLMREDTEYWFFPSGCHEVREGMRLTRPKLRELCCDVGPLSTLPCGVGGKELLTLEGLAGA